MEAGSEEKVAGYHSYALSQLREKVDLAQRLYHPSFYSTHLNVLEDLSLTVLLYTVVPYCYKYFKRVIYSLSDSDLTRSVLSVNV